MEQVKLGAADLKIIRHLQQDSRSSFAHIAAELGMPESTVRHRVNRMVQNRIIEFTLMTNPLQFGYPIWAMFEVQTEMPRIRSAAQKIAEAPEILFVTIGTGGFEIFAAGVFRSNQALLDFLTSRLSRIPGVIRTSTSSILEVVKRTHAFGIPDDLAANGTASKGGPATRGAAGPATKPGAGTAGASRRPALGKRPRTAQQSSSRRLVRNQQRPDSPRSGRHGMTADP